MVNGIILKKLHVLDETLAELRSLGPVTAEGLADDWLARRAVERDLQVLIEVVIDLCQRIISLAGLTPTESGADAVERCAQLGAISDRPSYRRMIQFRNFIVHRYERVDVAILADIVNKRLGDFDEFRQEVLSYAASLD